MSGLGRSQFRLGGSTLSRSASTVLSNPGRARRALQVADIRFHRAQRHRAGRKVEAAEHLGHALHFDHVAHAGRCAVAFNQGAGRGRQSGVLPGTLDGTISGPPDWAR